MRAAVAGACFALSWAAIAAGAPGAPPPDRFRLAGRVGGNDVIVEWIERTPQRIAFEEDGVLGAKMSEVKVALGGPTTATRIEGLQFNPFARAAGPGSRIVGERVGDSVRVTTIDLDHAHAAPVTRSEPWPADGIFLPRSFAGDEQVIQDMVARGETTRHFTWVDPLFRTESGSITFRDPTHVHLEITNAMAGAGDESDDFVVDAAGRIQGGELSIGPLVRRDTWIAPAARAGGPSGRRRSR